MSKYAPRYAPLSLYMSKYFESLGLKVVLIAGKSLGLMYIQSHRTFEMDAQKRKMYWSLFNESGAGIKISYSDFVMNLWSMAQDTRVEITETWEGE